MLRLAADENFRYAIVRGLLRKRNPTCCVSAGAALASDIMKTELITSLKRHATRIISELNQEKRPVLITERGQPSAYLVDPQTFDALQARLQILEGIARGEKAIQQKRIMSHAEAKRRMKRWLV
jgi:prevent-host-death family protein